MAKEKKREKHPGGPFRPGNQVSVGHAPGPGRPRREVERAYLDVTMGAVSLEDWLAVTKRALEDAKAGDPKAREWLSRYLLPAAKDEDGDGTGRLLVELALMRQSIEGGR